MAEEIAGRDLSILGLFHHADIVVKGIIIALLIASLISWTLVFEKLVTVWLLNREIGVLEFEQHIRPDPATPRERAHQVRERSRALRMDGR